MKSAEGSGAVPNLPSWLDWGLRILAAVVLLGLAAVTLRDENLATDEATFAAGAIVVALLMLALSLNRIAQLRSVRAFGVELDLAEKALEDAEAPGFGDETLNDESGETGGDEIVDLQLLLEAKLGYIAKHLLAREPRGHWSSFTTIGSLQRDGLLERSDAIAARRLLGLKAGDVEVLSKAKRTAYVEEAKPFVGAIRASVFYRLVEDQLELVAGKKPRPLGRASKRRPDLHLCVRVGRKRVHLLVFPAFAAPGGYWHKRERLKERGRELTDQADFGLIVVPPAWTADLHPQLKRVAILPLGKLVTAAEREEKLAALLLRLFPQLREEATA